MYEFESGATMGEGEIFEGGEFGGEMMEGEYFDESLNYGPLDSGYGRYGCSDGCLLHPFHCHQLYFRADYLLWWGKGFTAPPLVTTSTPGTSVGDAGVLGLPGTAVLFPGDAIADSSQSGGRARLGYWLDPCDTMAVEATYFAIGQANSSFTGSGVDFPILARPFVNMTPNVFDNDAQLVAYPGLYSGTLTATVARRCRASKWWRGTLSAAVATGDSIGHSAGATTGSTTTCRSLPIGSRWAAPRRPRPARR
jgi:hypothetical protein